MKLIIRAEEQGLLLWNDSLARTAWLDGPELEALKRWASGEENAFSGRLRRMGLIDDGCRDQVLEAAGQAKMLKAPRRSFCAPESLHVELTEQCPLHCPQCYKSKSPGELPFQELLSILRQAAKMKVFQVALGGGEPFLYSSLCGTVSEITRLGMSCSITTSGYGLDEEKLRILSELGLKHVQISLNGSTEEIHGKSRDGYQLGIRALELLCRHRKLSYGINWVARMDNVDDFPALAALGRRYGVHNINLLRYKPAARESYPDNRLTGEKLKQLRSMIRANRDIPLKVDSAFSGLLCSLNGYPGSFSGCGAGRRFLAVDAQGYYRPCSHMQLRERGESLRQIWYESPALESFRRLEEVIGEPCAGCAYLSGCRGCRAAVLAQGRDFNAGESGCCLKNPEPQPPQGLLSSHS